LLLSGREIALSILQIIGWDAVVKHEDEQRGPLQRVSQMQWVYPFALIERDMAQ
jgi:hypothetical protein